MANFFTSDLHFFHGASIFLMKSRREKFMLDIEHEKRIKRRTNQNGLEQEVEIELASVEEIAMMNDTIVGNINDLMSPNDVLWILGDFSFGNRAETESVLRSIIPRKILVPGNHDPKRMALYEALPAHEGGFEKITGWLHEEVFGDLRFVMMHYPLLVWNQSERGAIHLHGHLHGSVNPNYRAHAAKYKIIDVGIDGHPEFRPYSEQEIIDIMSTRENLW